MDHAGPQAAPATPWDDERPPPRVPDTPARRLRDAAEPIATVGFWAAPATARLAALGLDFLPGYVWARTAPLGEPSAPVVVAAFGVFEPRLITRAYEQGRGTASRADVLAARERGAVESLEELLPDAAPAALDGAGDLLRRATGVAAADLAGRPLFAGLLSLPWPGTPLGRVWHGASLLREYRGDVHVAAGVAAGLTGLEMNLLTEYWLGWAPTTYAATRGWSPAAMAAADAGLVERGLVAGGALTDEGRAVRDGVEERTDAAMAPLLEALGTGLPELTRQLAEWSAAVVTGGGGPADPRKRASG